MRISKAHSAVAVAEAPKVREYKFPHPKPVFSAPAGDWVRALLFMLSMSALGLHFYPALLVLIALMADSYRYNRYHFVLQVLLFFGDFDMVSQTLLYVKRLDMLIIWGFISIFLIKKAQKEVKKAVRWYWLFVGSTLVFAFLSPESMTVQIKMMRQYLSFVVFAVPLLLFAGKKFEPSMFFKILGVYALIMCSFYILDGFMTRGWIFIPDSYSQYKASTFYSPVAWPTRLTYFPRKYPRGLNILLLTVFPLIKYYRFNFWQWTLVILAFVSCRTMSVIGAFLFCFIVFQGGGKRLIWGSLCAAVILSGVYTVDKATGSFLRVASTIDQFRSLDSMMEREDLAEFGSTRAAQIIPKMELLYEEGRQWIGFGFMHPESNNEAFELVNDLYSAGSESENASVVEESHFQTILYVGYLGFIVQTIFYIGLYYIVRKHPISKFYLCELVAISIAGFGGFCSINWCEGLFPLAWSYSVVLLSMRKQNQIGEKG